MHSTARMGLPAEAVEKREMVEVLKLELKRAAEVSTSDCPEFRCVLEDAYEVLARYAHPELDATFELELAVSRALSALAVWRSLHPMDEAPAY